MVRHPLAVWEEQMVHLRLRMRSHSLLVSLRLGTPLRTQSPCRAARAASRRAIMSVLIEGEGGMEPIGPSSTYCNGGKPGVFVDDLFLAGFTHGFFAVLLRGYAVFVDGGREEHEIVVWFLDLPGVWSWRDGSRWRRRTLG